MFGLSNIDGERLKPFITLRIVPTDGASVETGKRSGHLHCVHHETSHWERVDYLPCKVIEGHLVIGGELGKVLCRGEAFDGMLGGLEVT